MIEYTIVTSENADWYIIPLNKLDQWESQTRYEYEGEEEWVTYIGDPSCVVFNDYRTI